MNCPYCGVLFSLDGVDADHCFPRFGRFTRYAAGLPRDEDEKSYSITSHKCPECKNQIIWLNELEMVEGAEFPELKVVSTTLLCARLRLALAAQTKLRSNSGAAVCVVLSEVAGRSATEVHSIHRSIPLHGRVICWLNVGVLHCDGRILDHPSHKMPMWSS